jgi:hypothetical protein
MEIVEAISAYNLQGEVNLVALKNRKRQMQKRLPFLDKRSNRFLKVAEPTGFEPATSDVTGRRSNQLNYDSARKPNSNQDVRC